MGTYGRPSVQSRRMNPAETQPAETPSWTQDWSTLVKARLSLLVLGHRGKLRKIEADLASDDLRAQLIALRIAVILCHARRDPNLDCVRISQSKGVVKVRCDADWAAEFPQSAYLLREEALAWQKTGWPMEFLDT